MKNILSLLLIGFVLLSCGSAEVEDDAFAAEYNVQDYVTKRLKAPSTAEFGGMSSTELEKGKFRVKGHVDAQNSFGGTRRNYFKCEIDLTKKGKYTIKDFEMH